MAAVQVGYRNYIRYTQGREVDFTKLLCCNEVDGETVAPVCFFEEPSKSKYYQYLNQGIVYFC